MNTSEKASASKGPSQPARHIRWRGPIWIVAVAGFCIAFFQLKGEAVFDWARGYRWLATEASIWAGLLALLIWMAFRSGFPGKVRCWGASIPVLMLVVFFAFFEFKRDGGLVPVGVRFRWTSGPTTDPLAPVHIDLSPTETARQDYPQFLGPNRNGTLTGYRLSRDWKKHRPREVWRREIGAGWSGFAIAGNYAFTQEQRGDQEMVTCYELLTGKPAWRHADTGGHFSNVTGDGPRATPTITDGRVFAVGGEGILNCLDAHTGNRLWSTNILEQFQADNADRGKSCSPLVLEKIVVVTGGSGQGPSIIAYDKQTGDVVWTGAWGAGKENEGTILNSYASPTLVELHGVPQILNVEDRGLASYDPDSGRQLWKKQWPWEGADPKVSQPVVLDGNRVFFSAEYSYGCVAYQIKRDASGNLSAEYLWESGFMRTKFSNVVVRDGGIFGVSDVILSCIHAETGERRWRRGGRYGHGQIIMADDLIVVMAEDGDVALVEANPESFHELGSFTALSDITWNNPALAIPDDSANVAYLLVRNDREAACFELARDPLTADLPDN